ncbi:MAG: hypothetical protein AAGC99_12515 [Pseudomonadota bacterium]
MIRLRYRCFVIHQGKLLGSCSLCVGQAKDCLSPVVRNARLSPLSDGGRTDAERVGNTSDADLFD